MYKNGDWGKQDCMIIIIMKLRGLGKEVSYGMDFLYLCNT